ncbi:MAG: MerR family transcriptional regulator [Myxococcales bacterium]|nr:MerR family transcriptional regulator [Myxococcales bacterium]
MDVDYSQDPRIPDKQYFRIGEVAEIVGVESYALRFWEGEFEWLAPSKSKTNQRTFCQQDVGLALRIRDLLYEEGFTIDGARRQFEKSKKACMQVPERATVVLECSSSIERTS